MFRDFWQPAAVMLLLVAGVFTSAAWALAILGGIAVIIKDAYVRIQEEDYALDYIAFLALAVSLATEHFGAGAIVALMFVGGKALEEYASRRAEGSLRELIERIPKTALVKGQDGTERQMPLSDITHGTIIVIKHGELIPLDGTLVSPAALLNEANLTGEAMPQGRRTGAHIKSGCVNAGEAFEMSVVGTLETSTYMRIVELVREARNRPARIVRLAERANMPFTIATLAISALAFALSGDIERVLAVLVIATPCPLIIAAPVAFIGGLSHAARHRIIVKTPAALEALTQAKTIFFDKTGTLTLGNPTLVETVMLDHAYDATHVLALAAAIEYHSIHPLARAMSAAREAARLPIIVARDVRETVGQGIAGVVNEQRYTITAAKPDGKGGILLAFSDGTHDIAHFRFEDVLKDDAGLFLKWIESQGVHVEILTGDSPENAERALGHFGIPIRAKTTPQDKAAAIARARAFGPVIMVGDGLNDAPALAHADVGIVFSGTENSAAIDAAAIAILGRDLGLIRELLEDARHTTKIAQESIWGGIILSVTGMLFAAFGHITPVVGALLQELIDVTVILNALRAAVVDEYRPMTGTEDQ